MSDEDPNEDETPPAVSDDDDGSEGRIIVMPSQAIDRIGPPYRSTRRRRRRIIQTVGLGALLIITLIGVVLAINRYRNDTIQSLGTVGAAAADVAGLAPAAASVTETTEETAAPDADATSSREDRSIPIDSAAPAAADPADPVDTEVEDEGGSAGRTTLGVSSNATATSVVPASADAAPDDMIRISGSIRDVAGGATVPRVGVWLNHSDHGLRPLSTDESGRYEVVTEPGCYDMTLRPGPGVEIAPASLDPEPVCGLAGDSVVADGAVIVSRVRPPTDCTIQPEGRVDRGVVVEEADDGWADHYRFWARDRTLRFSTADEPPDVVATGSRTWQRRPDEYFWPGSIYSVSAVRDGEISVPRSCRRQ